MKVLFVVSGNNDYYDIAPFIKSQGDSLVAEGIEVSYYLIKGKGALNYLKNIGPLKRYLKEHPADIIHAHYSLCGWVAVLAAGSTPVVLSYMGDDLNGAHVGLGKRDFRSSMLVWLGKAVQPFVQAIICKSPNLEKLVRRKSITHLIPNGVRLDQFAINEQGYRKELGLDPDKKYVLFLGDPANVNKNYALAEAATKLLNRPDVELIARYDVSHDLVVKYLNSANVFVLCSFSEGSPNVVKEAMACNCPTVVTDVGDAAWVVRGTQGCGVGGFDPADFAVPLARALEFSVKHGRTNGRERLLSLGLDAQAIARRLRGVYEQLLNADRQHVLSVNVKPNQVNQ